MQQRSMRLNKMSHHSYLKITEPENSYQEQWVALPRHLLNKKVTNSVVQILIEPHSVVTQNKLKKKEQIRSEQKWMVWYNSFRDID